MIVLGAAVLTGNKVSITPPEGGFGGIAGCRLSNYTGDVLILTNMNSDSPGQEYLMPFQQSVYHVENVRNPPTIVGVQLGVAFATQSLLIEWSTDPLTDFPGTYPSALTQAGLAGTSSPAWRVAELTVPAPGTTVSIPASLSRTSVSLIVDGANPVEWSATDTGWTTNPQIPVGNGRTVDTTAAIYLRGVGGASSVQWYDTHY